MTQTRPKPPKPANDNDKDGGMAAWTAREIEALLYSPNVLEQNRGFEARLAAMAASK